MKTERTTAVRKTLLRWVLLLTGTVLALSACAPRPYRLRRPPQLLVKGAQDRPPPFASRRPATA
jgi:hypothetical protein